MFIAFIFAVIGFVFALVLAIGEIRENSEYYDYGLSGFFDWCGGIIWFIISLFMGLAVGGAVGALLAIPIPMKSHLEQYEIQIANLQDGSSIHGSFFLGIGQVDGIMKYTYYTKSGEFYQLNQMDASGIRVKYTDGSPRITFMKRVLDKNETINKWGIDLDIGNKTDYIIEVPKGSVKSNFILDAQ